ncbi:MAG: hypothetical protein R3D67_15125 [Hyphomicrobiaceae bacterium]
MSPPGTLLPGEAATFTASYTLVQADIDAGGLNTATGTGTPPTGPAGTDGLDNGIDTDGNTTDDLIGDHDLSHAGDRDDQDGDGDGGQWFEHDGDGRRRCHHLHDRVAQHGNTTLSSVAVASDTLTRLGGGALALSSGPAFVSNSGPSAPGTLIPGETATFTATYTLVQADVDAGGVSTTATEPTPPTGPAVTDVSDNGIDTDGNTTDDPTVTTINRLPAIETTKTAAVTVANGLNTTATDAGDVITYTIALRNTGNTTLTSVAIASDTLTRLGGGALASVRAGVRVEFRVRRGCLAL